jgi:hypothetical protein
MSGAALNRLKARVTPLSNISGATFRMEARNLG